MKHFMLTNSLKFEVWEKMDFFMFSKTLNVARLKKVSLSSVPIVDLSFQEFLKKERSVMYLVVNDIDDD